MCGRLLLVCFVLLLLPVYFLVAEQPETWYLISGTELRSIEQYKATSGLEKQSWLLQAQQLDMIAANSEARSSRLETESGNLNQQLAQAREQNRKLEQSYSKSEADRLLQLSLKNGEIIRLKEMADKERLKNGKYKETAQTRLIIIIVLAGLWAFFIAFKVWQFIQPVPK